MVPAGDDDVLEGLEETVLIGNTLQDALQLNDGGEKGRLGGTALDQGAVLVTQHQLACLAVWRMMGE